MQGHFLWDVFIPFVTPPFFIYVNKFSFTEFFWLSSLEWKPCQIPTVSHLFYKSTYARNILHFQHYHSSLACCTLIFVGQFLLLIIHVMQLHFLLSVGESNNRCAVTIALKEVMWFVPGHDRHTLLSSDCYSYSVHS